MKCRMCTATKTTRFAGCWRPVKRCGAGSMSPMLRSISRSCMISRPTARRIILRFRSRARSAPSHGDLYPEHQQLHRTRNRRSTPGVATPGAACRLRSQRRIASNILDAYPRPKTGPKVPRPRRIRQLSREKSPRRLLARSSDHAVLPRSRIPSRNPDDQRCSTRCSMRKQPQSQVTAVKSSNSSATVYWQFFRSSMPTRPPLPRAARSTRRCKPSRPRADLCTIRRWWTSLLEIVVTLHPARRSTTAISAPPTGSIS